MRMLGKGKCFDKTGGSSGRDDDDSGKSGRNMCCFAAYTELLMAGGRTTPIEEVEAGDWVLAADPETGEQGAR